MIRVDLSEILRTKQPKLYHRIPRFCIRWIEKLICQKQINNVLERCGDKQGVPFITSTLDYLKIKRTSVGIEKLRKDGRYIFASNHPLGGLDGFSLAESIEAYFSSVKLVVNDILMRLTPVANIFIPINKHGKQSEEYAIGIRKGFDSNTQIVYFPAGLCSRLIDGKVTDPTWHKNFINKAIDSKRDIVPTFVDDKNSAFFYRFALLRKRLKIKANLEMLLLPKELFKKEGKGNIVIYYGEPITYERLINEERSAAQWVDYIRNECYKLNPANKK
ncbi:MAG: glycerol acyltransferase [Rikenellaceae bacterium]